MTPSDHPVWKMLALATESDEPPPWATAGQFAVLLFIAQMWEPAPEAWAWPSTRQIARGVRMSEGEVRKVIQQLEVLGLLDRLGLQRPPEHMG